jgi:hypothetical protein
MTTEQDRATVDGLPPLPSSEYRYSWRRNGFVGSSDDGTDLFTADQMREYARLAQVQQVPDEPDNQWIGDVMILTVLMQSDCVNEQEREVLARWIAAPASPGEAAQTTQGEPQ